MNIEQANRIPLAEILHKLNVPAGKTARQEMVYRSPFRDEQTPSFHVNLQKNLWFDFGEGVGGSVITLISLYLKNAGESHTPSDALRWLRNMMGHNPRIHPVPPKTKACKAKPPKLTLVSIGKLSHPALIDYLTGRGIPPKLASMYLSEIRLYNRETKRHSFALSFANDEGGFELRNPYLKITIKNKGISFIRGTRPKPDSIHFFEGFMDFLSALVHLKAKCFEGDVIVFNSLALMDHATPLVQNYGYRKAHSWLDNDAAGQKATNHLADFLQTEKDLQHIPMNSLYQPHKDVNAWHMHKLNLA